VIVAASEPPCWLTCFTTELGSELEPPPLLPVCVDPALVGISSRYWSTADGSSAHALPAGHVNPEPSTTTSPTSTRARRR
jgi:hypothetical protein